MISLDVYGKDKEPIQVCSVCGLKPPEVKIQTRHKVCNTCRAKKAKLARLQSRIELIMDKGVGRVDAELIALNWGNRANTGMMLDAYVHVIKWLYTQDMLLEDVNRDSAFGTLDIVTDSAIIQVMHSSYYTRIYEAFAEASFRYDVEGKKYQLYAYVYDMPTKNQEALRKKIQAHLGLCQAEWI